VEGRASSTFAAAPDPLTRYRGLQVASILLIVVSGALLLGASTVDVGLLEGGTLPTSSDRAVALLVVVILGGLGLVVGLVMNAVRALVAREGLAAERYRGPSILVLTALALVMGGVASVGLSGEALALLDSSGRITILGSLLVLTVTQLGLLGAAGLFVLAPHALRGLRLVPERGVLRTILIGAGLGVPAWLGAQALGVAIDDLLQRIGFQPGFDVTQAALDRVDPFVLVGAVVIFAPLAEELFFRGIVFNAWEREYGTRRAVYGSAGLFALIHGSIFALVPILALGIVLASVYRRTRSLPATIALHATFNGISVLLTLLVRFDILNLPLPT
jgi:membrane protease YdiL (CAAX protease family)